MIKHAMYAMYWQGFTPSKHRSQGEVVPPLPEQVQQDKLCKEFDQIVAEGLRVVEQTPAVAECTSARNNGKFFIGDRVMAADPASWGSYKWFIITVIDELAAYGFFEFSERYIVSKVPTGQYRMATVQEWEARRAG